MYKTKLIAVGKSRLLRRGSLQTWVKAEITGEFDTDPTIADIQEMIANISTILDEEEATENARWNAIKDQPSK